MDVLDGSLGEEVEDIRPGSAEPNDPDGRELEFAGDRGDSVMARGRIRVDERRVLLDILHKPVDLGRGGEVDCLRLAGDDRRVSSHLLVVVRITPAGQLVREGVVDGESTVKLLPSRAVQD